MGARNIGELVVPCQSDVTVVCPEGGQRGPEGARGGQRGAPWDLSHSTILPKMGVSIFTIIMRSNEGMVIWEAVCKKPNRPR